MDVNLNKHRDSMLTAWRDVVDDKSSTNWALFGYEGLSNDLKLMCKGDGGVEELIEELNSGSIMYAFCKVQDPKTSLPKFVLINWQGEGAPVVRKGICANHLRNVTDFLKGVHVTLNARTEEDVDPRLVIEKVAKSTGSSYSFKERSNAPNSTNAGPVGTAYKRVNPNQEINSKERDRFWEREEQEERKRQEEERKRRQEERQRQEEERRQNEIAEVANREKRLAQESAIRNAARQAEHKVASAEQQARIESSGMKNELAEREREEVERRERSEVLRRQRSEEAQSLIAKRTINARAVFEQNTVAGQLNVRRASHQLASNSASSNQMENFTPPSERGRKASLPTWPPLDQSVEQITQVPKPSPDLVPTITSHNEISSTLNSKENIKENHPPPDEENSESDNSQTGTIVRKSHRKEPENNGIEVSKQPSSQPAPDVLPTNGASTLLDDDDDEVDLGLRARALYDYQAADSTEISFDPGDIITNIEQIDEGWWQGLSTTGIFGLFPANYVELLD